MLKTFGALAVLATGLACLPGDAAAQPACGDNPAATVGNTTYCGFPASGDVNAFLGIRYATTRSIWDSPVPVPYDGQATSETAQDFGPPCLQPTSVDNTPYIAGDQDCLYLNIWAPKQATTDTPVMVWIHGGAFIIGSGADNAFDLTHPSFAGDRVSYESDRYAGTYNGTTLAETGVIVVSVNYRLGAPGFLASTDPKMSVPANLGLRDQQTAMKWVQQNIARFTATPDTGPQTGPITLFGESAGAMSVGLHLMGDIAGSASLFDRAIMESNPMGYYYKSPENADLEANLFFQCLLQVIDGSVDPFKAVPSAGSADGATKKACADTAARTFSDTEYQTLAAASADDVMRAQAAFGVSEIRALLSAMLVPGALPWSPVIDGSFVMQQPLGVEGAVLAPAKPYMFGFNDQEGALFADAIQTDISYLGLSGLDPVTYPILLNMILGKPTSKAVRDYTDGNNQAPYSALHPFGYQKLNNAAGAVSAVINDFAFRCGNFHSARQALPAQADSKVYAYHFAPTDPQPYQVMSADLPACNAGNPDGFICHTMEIPSVFGTFASTHSGPVKTYLNPSAITPEMTGLQEKMTTAWSNFAKSGDPTRPTVGGAQTVFPEWTAYSAGDDESNVLTMTSGDKVEMQALYAGSNCGFWDASVFANMPLKTDGVRMRPN